MTTLYVIGCRSAMLVCNHLTIVTNNLQNKQAALECLLRLIDGRRGTMVKNTSALQPLPLPLSAKDSSDGPPARFLCRWRKTYWTCYIALKKRTNLVIRSTIWSVVVSKIDSGQKSIVTASTLVLLFVIKLTILSNVSMALNSLRGSWFGSCHTYIHNGPHRSEILGSSK